MKFHFVDPVVLLIILTVVVGVIGLVSFIFGLIAWINGGNKISGRLEHYVTVKTEPKVKNANGRILAREVTGSLFSRTILQFFKNINNLLIRLAPDTQLDKLDHDLVIAGNPMGLHARDFYIVQIVCLMIGAAGAVILNLNNKPLDMVILLVGILVFILFAILPKAWLNGRVRKTKDEIRRDLPDALDMLSVCASAGLGFDQSLQKISEYWKTTLGLEIRKVIREMEMGVSRSVSLQNLSDRLDVDDLTRFITIIIQAETMGMSYADVLHTQASQMRVLRQFRAKEIANKLPAKMIIPLATLIFPALLAVIIGPVVPTLLDLF